MKRAIILITAVTLLFSNTSGQQKSTFHWPGKYQAAVVLSYDDGLDCHLDVAVPALDEYGFKGTFYCTGDSRSLQNRLDEWRAIAAEGHELGNHTLFHPCDGTKNDWLRPEYDLNKYTVQQVYDELFTANTLLKAIDGREQRTLAYTCTDYRIGEKSFIDDISNLFVAARGGGPIPASMDEVDIYNVPSWGVNDPSGKELIDYVKEAQKKGTIAVFMFHSVGGGYLNVSDEAHRELLAWLRKHDKEIWTGTFLEVMSYVKEQRN